MISQTNRKNRIFVQLITLSILFGIVVISKPVYARSAVLSAPIVEEFLTPGSTLHINITITDIINLWGFQFVLIYDTAILTAISHSANNPFVNLVYSEINDEAGNLTLAYTLPFGTNTGFSGNTSLVRIDFTVDALGNSTLNLTETKLCDPFGNPINHDAVDGRFTNLASLPRTLTVKLAGEHDYLSKEHVRIRLSALVTDAETREPVSYSDVTLEIYDPNGELWVSDLMVERLIGTGIYEWQTEETIHELTLEKGIYLVHVKASFQGGPFASNIIQFHIDPPSEDLSTFPLHHYLIVLFAILIIAAGLTMLRHRISNLLRRTTE